MASKLYKKGALKKLAMSRIVIPFLWKLFGGIASEFNLEKYYNASFLSFVMKFILLD